MAIYYVPLTIDTAAYSTGDVVGGKITIPDNNAGLLTAVTVIDADAEGVQLDFFLFAGTLTGTSGYTNNAAYAQNSADDGKELGTFSVLAADYVAAGTGRKMATKTPTNIQLKSGGTTCIVVIRSTTTFTAVTDLRLVFHVLER